jgi:hypothetical protein
VCATHTTAAHFPHTHTHTSSIYRNHHDVVCGFLCKNHTHIHKKTNNLSIKVTSHNKRVSGLLLILAMSTAVVSTYDANVHFSLIEILSQYVYSSHKTYKSMYSKYKDNSEEDGSSLIRKSSVNLRQSVSEFVRMLSGYAEELDHSGAGDVDVVDSAIDIINDSQKLWHITEFFILAPSQSVCMDTILWLQVCLVICSCGCDQFL